MALKEKQRLTAIFAIKQLFRILYVALTFALLSSAFADTSQIETGFFSGAEKAYSIITAIVAPLSAVLLAICAAKILWGNQKAAEEAKSFLVRMIVALFFVFGAPLIVVMVKGWFSTEAWWQSSAVLEP